MIRKSKSQSALLQDYAKWTAERARAEQGLSNAKNASDALATELSVQRSSSDGGPAANEKLRRASAKFDEAEKQCADLEVELKQIQNGLARLHPLLQSELNGAMAALLAEGIQEFEAAVRPLLTMAQRLVAYEHQLKISIPPNLSTLNIPMLTGKWGDSHPLIPTIWDGHQHSEAPVVDNVAREQIEELRGLLTAVESTAIDAKRSRDERQDSEIAAQRQEADLNSKNPYRNAHHI